MFILEKFEKKDMKDPGDWKFYATYHERRLLDLMVEHKEHPELFRIVEK